MFSKLKSGLRVESRGNNFWHVVNISIHEVNIFNVHV